MFFFFFKQKTAYEIKECDWSSDVCSSDLGSLIIMVSFKTVPQESVIVTMYVPAVNMLISSVVSPLDQLKVYCGVPPVTVKSAAPVLSPLQIDRKSVV